MQIQLQNVNIYLQMFEVWSVVVAPAPQLQPLPQTSSQARYLDYILLNPFAVFEFYWERIKILYLNFIFFPSIHVQTGFPCQIDGINVRMLPFARYCTSHLLPLSVNIYFH